MVKKTYLELKQGTKHEHWQIEVDGSTQKITSGKVGSKKPPKEASKTLKSADAAKQSAAKEIAKKKAAFYFDPSSIQGILEAHREHLAIPTEEDVKAHRKALPHATEDYFEVYATGALSIGFFRDFAPAKDLPHFDHKDVTGLFVASSAADHLDAEAHALDPYFYVVGTYYDGSTLVQYNQGKHAGRLGLIEHGPSDELLEHLVAGDSDATIAAWIENELVEPPSKLSFSAWVRMALLQYKGAAVDRLEALNAAIAVVKEAVAGDPQKVTELDLSEKGLRALPAFLGDCVNLEVLSLRKNELEDVPGALRGMKKLRVLDHYYNAIDTTALPDWLRELTLLTKLNLAINTGGALSSVVCDLKTLEELTLPELTSVPASIGALSALRSLDISGVKGPIEEGGLGRLENVKTLTLGTLSAPLPADIGGMKSLELLKIDVSERDAFPLPASIARLQSLRTLIVEASKLPNEVCELTGLEELKVRGNKDGLPENLSALKSLRKLNLNLGRMTALPASIGDLQNLEHLNLESCSVEKLPESFARLTNLRWLSLATASATEVGDCLANFENLEFLAINTPVLRKVTQSSLKKLRNLKTLKVFTKSSDKGDQDLLDFVRDLPALTTFGCPYDFKDHYREALPKVTID